MREPLETAELQAFAKTVEAKSLSRAALELGLPRATISRRLARLEERLGARLLRRTTRSLAVTAAGDALYRHARVVLEAVKHAEASVQNTDALMRGDVRISVPPMLEGSFYQMVHDFCRKHPAVRVHVHSSTQHVDLQRGAYDLALRAGTQLEPGLVARSVGKTPLWAVASPAYLAGSAPLRTPRDLRHHRLLVGFARGELPETHWLTKSGSRLHVEGAFSSNDLNLLCDLAVRGLGIAYLPTPVSFHHVERGELVQVLPGVLEVTARIALVYPERELLAPQVRAFIDAMLAWAPGGLMGPVLKDGVARCAAPRAPSSQTRRRAKPAR